MFQESCHVSSDPVSDQGGVGAACHVDGENSWRLLLLVLLFRPFSAAAVMDSETAL